MTMTKTTTKQQWIQLQGRPQRKCIFFCISAIIFERLSGVSDFLFGQHNQKQPGESKYERTHMWPNLLIVLHCIVTKWPKKTKRANWMNSWWGRSKGRVTYKAWYNILLHITFNNLIQKYPTKLKINSLATEALREEWRRHGI